MYQTQQYEYLAEIITPTKPNQLTDHLNLRAKEGWRVRSFYCQNITTYSVLFERPVAPSDTTWNWHNANATGPINVCS